MPKVLAHVVTFDSSDSVISAVRSLLEQNAPGIALNVRVTDNASTNNVLSLLQAEFDHSIDIRRNEFNFGFSGAHNQAASDLIQGDYDYLLIVNPDLRLEPNAVEKLIRSVESHADVGSACPLLYRADSSLRVCHPKIIDAAGMYMTPQLRHFDRGSGEPDHECYHQSCYVFGGSGACLLLKKRFVAEVSLKRREDESVLELISSGLSHAAHGRIQLFDEAFLAYREDADLAWRAQILGWRCLFVPSAVGYHTRVVLPERRSKLAPELNRYSVRNRFLMQINNYMPGCGARSLLEGVLLRNFMVILGVMLREQSSLQALRDVVRLLSRSWAHRREIAGRAKQTNLRHWFSTTPYTEPV